MTLRTWLTAHSRTITWLAQAAGVGFGTAQRAASGKPLKIARVIRAISEVTGGEVTASELERGT